MAGDAAGLFVDFLAFLRVAEGVRSFYDIADVRLGIGWQCRVDTSDFHEQWREFGICSAEAVEGLERQFGGGGGNGVGLFQGEHQRPVAFGA